MQQIIQCKTHYTLLSPTSLLAALSCVGCRIYESLDSPSWARLTREMFSDFQVQFRAMNREWSIINAKLNDISLLSARCCRFFFVEIVLKCCVSEELLVAGIDLINLLADRVSREKVEAAYNQQKKNCGKSEGKMVKLYWSKKKKFYCSKRIKYRIESIFNVS